jgi:hypothetical protein
MAGMRPTALVEGDCHPDKSGFGLGGEAEIHKEKQQNYLTGSLRTTLRFSKY